MFDKVKKKQNKKAIRIIIFVYLMIVFVSGFGMYFYRQEIGLAFYNVRDVLSDDPVAAMIPTAGYGQSWTSTRPFAHAVRDNFDENKSTGKMSVTNSYVSTFTSQGGSMVQSVGMVDVLGDINTSSQTKKTNNSGNGLMIPHISFSSKSLLAMNGTKAKVSNAESNTNSSDNDPTALFAENTLQRTSSSVNTDVAPSGDPDADTGVPLGDNLVPLLSLCVAYSIYKYNALKLKC